jgi:hypothetical protein
LKFSLRGKPLLLALLLFAVFYPQAPLYTDNQNTKFLHGAANAGWGHLGADWTANTLDPLPVFTALVEAVYRWLPTGTFHALFAILVAVYGWAVIGITRSVHPGGLEGSTAWIFTALFALLHFTPLNAELLDGVAKQYILDHYLQPCVFGVLVLLAIRLMLDRRNLPAALCLAGAVLFHPGAYLMAAALILAVMVWLALKQKTPYTRALAPVAVFASLVAPLAIYQASAFAPTSPETWRQAIDILANQRIPHHTQVGSWLDAGNVARLGVLIWVCWLLRGSRPLFYVMATLTGFVLMSSLALLIAPDAAAAFSTPWRVTAILVPIAMVILIHRLSLVIARSCERRGLADARIRNVALAVIVAMAAFAVLQTLNWQTKYDSKNSSGVITHARNTAGEGQRYLVPPRKPDFDHFRLEAGVPILANWKSHPYRDIEVIEWYSRVQAADRMYKAKDAASRNLAAQQLIDSYRITHLVVPNKVIVDLPNWVEVYADMHYRLYSKND